MAGVNPYVYVKHGRVCNARIVFVEQDLKLVKLWIERETDQGWTKMIHHRLHCLHAPSVERGQRNANGVKRSQEPMVREIFCLSQVVSNRASGRVPSQNSYKHRLSSVLNADTFSSL